MHDTGKGISNVKIRCRIRVSFTTGVHVVGIADKSSPPSPKNWTISLTYIDWKMVGQKTQHQASVIYEEDCAWEGATVKLTGPEDSYVETNDLSR